MAYIIALCAFSANPEFSGRQPRQSIIGGGVAEVQWRRHSRSGGRFFTPLIIQCVKVSNTRTITQRDLNTHSFSPQRLSSFRFHFSNLRDHLLRQIWKMIKAILMIMKSWSQGTSTKATRAERERTGWAIYQDWPNHHFRSKENGRKQSTRKPFGKIPLERDLSESANAFSQVNRIYQFVAGRWSTSSSGEGDYQPAATTISPLGYLSMFALDPF